MKIIRMKTNHLENPLGFDLGSPVLSWTVGETSSKLCREARVEIALDENYNDMVHDSGYVSGISGISYHPNITLKPRTRYFWRVTVRGDRGDQAQSATQWFETSKLDEDWVGEWITPDMDTETHPYLRKGFELPSAVKSARLYASGLGVYIAEINGARVGDEHLAPGFHSYDRWMQYQTYDVTSMLAPGSNALGVMLGNGWAKGRFGFDGGGSAMYCDKFFFNCELRVTLDNGTELVLGTDGSWKSAANDVMFSGIYDGEHIDSRKAVRGWSGMRFDDSAWNGVKIENPPVGQFSARLSPRIVTKHMLKPVAVIHTPAGETVLDMGQNIVGFLEFSVAMAAGSEIKLTFGEILQNDNFYTDNLRTAKQEFIYISDGSPATVQPRFTFYGFRYVKVEGWGGEVSCDDFTAHVIYSDLETVGNIETSNPDVNRLFQNAMWGQRGNFVDVPTDCPQRDERMGWTGDAQVFSGTALFNMDSAAFYKKFLRDMWEEQQKHDGNVPNVVPDVLKEFMGGFAGGAVAWADSAAVIPWNTYLHSGDIAVLEYSYRNMKAWVDWITKTDGGNGGLKWAKSFHFGDWLALDNYRAPTSPVGGTENGILCSAYYLYSTRLTAKAAHALGKDDEAKLYDSQADDILAVLHKEYFTPSGRLAVTTQTAHVVALFLGLAPDRRRTAEDLVSLLLSVGDVRSYEEYERNKRYKLTTGFIGTPWLCRALSGEGENKIAYSLLLNDDYPSWLYEVKMGATTIWERWNSVLPDGLISETGMNSLNHYAYGSIAEWMYRDMCGLNPCEDAPGFRHANLSPKPDARLTFAKCVVNTAAGLYRSGWEYLPDGSLKVTVTVPFDAEASLVLPDAKLNEVVAKSGLKPRQKGSHVEFTLSAGDYEFVYKPIEL